MNVDPQTHRPPFREGLLGSVRLAAAALPSTRFTKHANVYNAGDRGDHIYVIERGRVKLRMLSASGKECLLAIHGAGDVFGELCLCESGAERLETATAMDDGTTLKAVPSAALLAVLHEHQLWSALVQYLAVRIARQQHIITSLVTVDCEHRLAEALLLLARTVGTSDTRSTRIEPRLSHEELAQIVGTTRPRITGFMKKFRSLGLVRTTPRNALVVQEAKLAAYASSFK